MIEILILTPRVPTSTQDPVGNSPLATTVTQEPIQHQFEILEYENELLKEGSSSTKGRAGKMEGGKQKATSKRPRHSG